MLLRIRTGYFEVWEINPTSLSVSVEESSDFAEKYHKCKDRKWFKFCKEHNFNPYKDADGKIYDLYLRLCAEGLC